MKNLISCIHYDSCPDDVNCMLCTKYEIQAVGIVEDCERELLIIQDLQKMPRDKYGKLMTHIPYSNVWYVK